MAQLDDVCPYDKPFPEGFADCPAYQPVDFVALDTQYRPLASRLTCRHLEARSLPRGDLKGFYPRCGLGDAAARVEWATRWRGERLAAIRDLSRALAASTGPVMREMWVAKGDQLRALRSQQPVEEPLARLAVLAADYTRQATGFLESRRLQCDKLGLPVDACIELIAAVLGEWVERTTLDGAYTIPEELSDRFPPELRALVLPNG